VAGRPASLPAGGTAVDWHQVLITAEYSTGSAALMAIAAYLHRTKLDPNALPSARPPTPLARPRLSGPKDRLPAARLPAGSDTPGIPQIRTGLPGGATHADGRCTSRPALLWTTSLVGVTLSGGLGVASNRAHDRGWRRDRRSGRPEWRCGGRRCRSCIAAAPLMMAVARVSRPLTTAAVVVHSCIVGIPFGAVGSLWAIRLTSSSVRSRRAPTVCAGVHCWAAFAARRGRPGTGQPAGTH
jgi:hypothetical protein